MPSITHIYAFMASAVTPRGTLLTSRSSITFSYTVNDIAPETLMELLAMNELALHALVAYRQAHQSWRSASPE